MCLFSDFDVFWTTKILLSLLDLSIILKLTAKTHQKEVWSNSRIYVFTSWIWTRFDSFFESTFRICNAILKNFSTCNQIMILGHFTDNSVFFESCVVGGLKTSSHHTKKRSSYSNYFLMLQHSFNLFKEAPPFSGKWPKDAFFLATSTQISNPGI